MNEQHMTSVNRNLVEFADELVAAGMEPDTVASAFLHAASVVTTGYYGVSLGGWLIEEAGRRIRATQAEARPN